jgi:hypothetical protein
MTTFAHDLLNNIWTESEHRYEGCTPLTVPSLNMGKLDVKAWIVRPTQMRIVLIYLPFSSHSMKY